MDNTLDGATLLQKLQRDADGFLRNPQDWSRPCAHALASEHGLCLTDQHWPIIELVRAHYLEHELHLTNRALIKLLGQTLPPDQANSIYLHQLFVQSPARQIALFAGLPKPPFCF